MKLKALIPFYLLPILAGAFGIYYILRSSPPPYHQDFIEVPFTTLSPQLQAYILGLIHIVGVLFLSLAIALAVYIHQNSKSDSFVKVGPLLLFTLPPLAVLQYFTLLVGGQSPVWAPALGILFAIFGSLAVYRARRKS